ncbi:MAG TPA: class I SAM-dependent methyltransferase [bacterium]
MHFDFRRAIIEKYSQPEEIAQYTLEAEKELFDWEKWILAKYIKGGEKVLVLGSGAGREVFGIEKMNVSAYGVDICLPLLNSAKSLMLKDNHKGFLMAGDALQLGFKKETFNLCIMFRQFLQHFPFRKNRMRLLKEAGRILDKGGILLLSLHLSPFSFSPYRIANHFCKIFFAERASGPANPVMTESKEPVLFRILRKLTFVVLGTVINITRNTCRRIYVKLKGENYKGLEPNDFYISSISAAHSKGKILFHDYSAKEILEDLSAAGFMTVEWSDIDELGRNKPYPSWIRRGASFVCIVAKKTG